MTIFDKLKAELTIDEIAVFFSDCCSCSDCLCKGQFCDNSGDKSCYETIASYLSQEVSQ